MWAAVPAGLCLPPSVRDLSFFIVPGTHVDTGQRKTGRVQLGWRWQLREPLGNTLQPGESHDRNRDRLGMAPAKPGAVGDGAEVAERFPAALWGLEPTTVLIA